MRIVLHFTQFMVRRQKRYQLYGPWEHIPTSIWREDEAPEVDDEDGDTHLCQVCGKKRRRKLNMARCAPLELQVPMS